MNKCTIKIVFSFAQDQLDYLLSQPESKQKELLEKHTQAIRELIESEMDESGTIEEFEVTYHG